jgi:hypothetical protein
MPQFTSLYDDATLITSNIYGRDVDIHNGRAKTTTTTTTLEGFSLVDFLFLACRRMAVHWAGSSISPCPSGPPRTARHLLPELKLEAGRRVWETTTAGGYLPRAYACQVFEPLPRYMEFFSNNTPSIDPSPRD